MKWPWQRGREPVQTTIEPPALADDAPSVDLQEARQAAIAAHEAYLRAQERRHAVAATGRALERTNSRNHFAELVRGALGSGSGS